MNKIAAFRVIAGLIIDCDWIPFVGRQCPRLGFGGAKNLEPRVGKELRRVVRYAEML